MLISEARNEKNLQDSKAGHQAKKQKQRNNKIIKWFHSKIEEEKEAVKDCLNQNYFSIAKDKIERTEEMTIKN